MILYPNKRRYATGLAKSVLFTGRNATNVKEYVAKASQGSSCITVSLVVLLQPLCLSSRLEAPLSLTTAVASNIRTSTYAPKLPLSSENARLGATLSVTAFVTGNARRTRKFDATSTRCVGWSCRAQQLGMSRSEVRTRLPHIPQPLAQVELSNISQLANLEGTLGLSAAVVRSEASTNSRTRHGRVSEVAATPLPLLRLNKINVQPYFTLDPVLANGQFAVANNVDGADADWASAPDYLTDNGE